LAVFLGLGLGLGSGLVFFFLGAWLIIRAYRLQKYGTPSMLTSNRVAREMATARKEGREPDIEAITGNPTTLTKGVTKPSSTSAPAKLPTPEASKRYTPKKPPRKRR
jgi:hypothetical protein